jgi:hypothetical protein
VSTRIAIALVVVCASVGAVFADANGNAVPAEVPPGLQQLIATHCTRCHNETHTLNLKKLPAANDRATWALLLDEVSSGSMPPPKEDEAIVDRFPLDPSVRAEIVRMLEPLAAAEHVPSARFITNGAWIKAATRLAGNLLEAKQVGKLASGLGGAELGAAGRGRNFSAEQQLELDRASIAVCGAIAAAPAPSGSAAGPSVVPAESTPAARKASIELIEQRLFGISRPAEVKRSAARYDRFLAHTKDAKQAWTMLCTLYLSGPRLIYGAYLRGSDE